MTTCRTQASLGHGHLIRAWKRFPAASTSPLALTGSSSSRIWLVVEYRTEVSACCPQQLAEMLWPSEEFSYYGVAHLTSKTQCAAWPPACVLNLRRLTKTMFPPMEHSGPGVAHECVARCAAQSPPQLCQTYVLTLRHAALPRLFLPVAHPSATRLAPLDASRLPMNTLPLLGCCCLDQVCSTDSTARNKSAETYRTSAGTEDSRQQHLNHVQIFDTADAPATLEGSSSMTVL